MEAIMSTVSSVSFETRGISGRSWTGRLATLKRWLVAYLTWRIEQAAISELLSMSDRTLRDIGLTRSGIPRAVMGDTSIPPQGS
jgi:uncharacterized protein YjiS (DUF1127 family)